MITATAAPRMALLAGLLLPIGSQAATVLLDFEQEPLGASSGDYPGVSITGAPYPLPRSDCRDLAIFAAGRGLRIGGTPSNCNDRSGVVVVEAGGSGGTNNGVMILTFDEPVDLVAFEVHQNLDGVGTEGGVHTVVVRAYDANDELLGSQSQLDGVAEFALLQGAMQRVEVEVADGFVLDNLVFETAPPVPVYACDGFYPPADKPLTVRGNRTIPLKARVFDADGHLLTLDDLPVPPEVQIWRDGQTLDSQQVVEVTEDGQLLHHLRTKGLVEGTYQLTLVAGDESAYVISPSCVAEITR